MNRELVSQIKAESGLDIQIISTDTTTAGNIIDTQGFDSLTFLFNTGVITDGDYLLLIEEGDDSGLSDAAAVADADLTTTEALASFTADTDDGKVSKIGYTGSKQFVRASIVSTNTSTGGTMGIVAVDGHPSDQPQSTVIEG